MIVITNSQEKSQTLNCKIIIIMEKMSAKLRHTYYDNYIESYF